MAMGYKIEKQELNEEYAKDLDEFISKFHNIDDDSRKLVRDLLEDQLFDFAPLFYSSIKYSTIKNMQFVREIKLKQIHERMTDGGHWFAEIVLKFQNKRLCEVKRGGYATKDFFTKVCLWINAVSPFQITIPGKKIEIQ